jgi:hypothetical protein
MEDKPMYKVGDRVYERFPKESRENGTVLDVYKFEEHYRYIVRFDDGTSGVFFSGDLVQAA